MDGLELYDRLRPLRDAAADNAYMLGDERERGMYDGYGEVMRRCLELPQADVEDWIYGFTHAIRESGDADTEYARGRGAAMDCVIWSLGPTGRELREAIEKRLGAEDPGCQRMEATIADGAIEVVRVSGDSRVVREAPKESHTAYHDPSRTSSHSAPSCRAIPRRDAWPPLRKGDRHAQ